MISGPLIRDHSPPSKCKVGVSLDNRETVTFTYFSADSKEIEWTGLKFSPDGKSILISTNGSVIKLIDSYNGSTLQSFTGHMNSKMLPLEASFSPDSQFVISGSSDGRIHIWNSENGQKVCVLNGDHKSPVQCVQVWHRTIIIFRWKLYYCMCMLVGVGSGGI